MASQPLPGTERLCTHLVSDVRANVLQPRIPTSALHARDVLAHLRELVPWLFGQVDAVDDARASLDERECHLESYPAVPAGDEPDAVGEGELVLEERRGAGCACGDSEGMLAQRG